MTPLHFPRLLIELAAAARNGLGEERRRRADRQALARLPDRILKDIGMARCGIPYAVHCPDFHRQREALARRLEGRPRAPRDAA